MDHFELASALRGVVSDLHKRLRKQVYAAEGMTLVENLSMTELMTLSYLHREGALSPSELADINKIKKQSMSQVLVKMEKLKLIRRMVSKEDKRKVMISLTPMAEKIVKKTRYERDEWLAGAIKAVMGEKDVRLLEAVIPFLERIANVK